MIIDLTQDVKEMVAANLKNQLFMLKSVEDREG